jgi:anti-sigma factor ChrR (cupin superfamily)
MSPASDHGQDYAERVFPHALGTLPAAEVPAMDAHLAECADCRTVLQNLRPVVEAFVAWPTNVLRPPTSLWERLTRRIAAETGQEPLLPAPPRPVEPEWHEAAPGISYKLLATDAERNYVSMLVRLEPNTAYPSHRHAGVEELHLLDGELWIEDRKLYPGDYNRGEPGAVDRRVWSETGCTCVLVTSYHDVIL